MSLATKTVYIDLDHDTLAVARIGARVVDRWATARRPESVRADDAAAVGAWIAGVLDESGVGRGRAVFAVARSEVVLKLLRLPGGDALDEGELANLVRLQIARQTAVSIDDAVVDYTPLESDGGGERLVLVGAIPGERVEWRRRLAEACGMKLGGVRLRAAGVAELVASTRGEESAPTLGVSIGPESVELALCESGELVFARTVELGEAAGSVARTAVRVAVESKRTAMSFRVAQQTPDVGRVVVLGRDEASRHVALACAEELGVPGEAVWPDVVGLDGAEAAQERAVLALVGLARRERAGRALMNFAEPRKAPDKEARRRQLALAGVFLLIAVVGAAWVVSKRSLDGLEQRVEAAQGAAQESWDRYLGALAADARASHAERWAGEDTDWLAHIDRVGAELPGPDSALLDTLSGSADSEVRFAPGTDRPYPGRWSVEHRITMDVAGRAGAPGVPVGIRAALLEMGEYGVETKGPDVENAFAFELTTDRSRPGGGVEGTP